jgi:hypothetical protein
LLLIKIQKQIENFSNYTALLLCYSPSLGLDSTHGPIESVQGHKMADNAAPSLGCRNKSTQWMNFVND